MHALVLSLRCAVAQALGGSMHSFTSAAAPAPWRHPNFPWWKVLSDTPSRSGGGGACFRASSSSSASPSLRPSIGGGTASFHSSFHSSSSSSLLRSVTSSSSLPRSFSSSARGRYDRGSAKVKLTHGGQAGAHLVRIRATALAGSCTGSCRFGGNCLDSVSRNAMISCHECVYGETLQVGTEWTTSFRKSASTAAWGEVVTAAARYGPDDTFESFEFTVSGHRVCTDTARQVYGVPVSTWLALLAIAPEKQWASPPLSTPLRSNVRTMSVNSNHL